MTGGSGGMLATDTTEWTVNEATVAGNKLRIPFYEGANGDADLVPAPVTNGHVLAYNDTGNGSLEWVSAGSATELTVTDKTDTNNTAFKIGFTNVAAGSGTSFMVSDDLTFNTDTANNNLTALLSMKEVLLEEQQVSLLLPQTPRVLAPLQLTSSTVLLTWPRSSTQQLLLLLLRLTRSQSLTTPTPLQTVCLAAM